MKITEIETVQLAEFANLPWLRIHTGEGLVGPGETFFGAGASAVPTASVHLSLNAPNSLIQETVRAYHTGWYKELVTELPVVENGQVYPMTGPGLGTKLIPDIQRRADAAVRRTTA
jgi:L-alanine-DL-glutamate epimerase-like enolase superfamily enzyme